MEKANVTWLGSENRSEPTQGEKIAKAVDDYMNNETEDLVLPEDDDDMPQSLEEALMMGAVGRAPQSRTVPALVRALTRIPLAV